MSLPGFSSLKDLSQIKSSARPCPASFAAPPELHAALSGIAKPVINAKGTPVFGVNEPALGIFVVRSGSVKVTVPAANGESIISRVAGPGSVLGFSAAMCAHVYQFTAEALEMTELGFMETATLNDYLRSRTDLCMQVVTMMSSELSEIQETSQHMRTCTHTECALHASCRHSSEA